MKTLRALAGAQVMVNLTTGDAVGGRIRAATATTVDITAARLYGKDHPEGYALEGTVIIPSDKIAWVQVAG